VGHVARDLQSQRGRLAYLSLPFRCTFLMRAGLPRTGDGREARAILTIR
jgi:hypothetical protein